MNVIFTCGGTGGHINPAIALANTLRQRDPSCRILFVGCVGQMEEQLVPKAGYEIKCVGSSYGLVRGLDPKSIANNIKGVFRTVKAINDCKKILKEFQPDVIMGTGGFACFPALMAGSMMKIPTCVHESNALPGLTTRMLASRVDRTLICFPESAAQYKEPKKLIAVGMPIRQEFVRPDRLKARKELGIGEEELLVVSAFGSLGATRMNEITAELFALEKRDGFPFRHIHATGKWGWEWMADRALGLGVDLSKCPSIDMREYIYNMSTVMAAADVIIGRSGASTCNEIAATGLPTILIPSPNVTDNHQEKNARVLVDKGGAVMILEADSSAEAVYAQIKQLLSDGGRRDAMRTALQKNMILDSAERICDILDELAAGNA